jgi:hypothetical protein
MRLVEDRDGAYVEVLTSSGSTEEPMSRLYDPVSTVKFTGSKYSQQSTVKFTGSRYRQQSNRVFFPRAECGKKEVKVGGNGGKGGALTWLRWSAERHLDLRNSE